MSDLSRDLAWVLFSLGAASWVFLGSLQQFGGKMANIPPWYSLQ